MLELAQEGVTGFAGVALILGVVGPAVGGAAAAASATPLSIRVVGDTLVNGSGVTVQLRGSRPRRYGIRLCPGLGDLRRASDAASVAAIARWDTNAVRIPLNEDCWLGINGVPVAFGGSPYRQAIINYVSELLNQHGIYAILDLSMVAPGTTLADSQQPMPDEDHSPTFWTSIATAFKGNPAAIFDLFNEPYPDNNSDTTAAWKCWQLGGTCVGVPYPVAGMQQLVSAVRATGATNVIMLGGIGYASVLNHWATYAPNGPRWPAGS